MEATQARSVEAAEAMREAVMPRGAVEPHLFVILGATGDLTSRKLLPAVASLMSRGALHPHSAVLGAALGSGPPEDQYRAWAADAFPDDAVTSEWCQEAVYYEPLNEGTVADYEALAHRIEKLESRLGLPGNRIFYLALPPAAFPAAIDFLGRAGLSRSPGWTRLVIEKPFGRDLASAQALNRCVHEWFDEEQVYRIDHYLGKETVRNLLVFRFANPIFESLWNRNQIESVHFTVAESLGVGHRAGYYDRNGALRDMVQNHLTQLLTLMAMEVPASFDAEAIRNEKVKVLHTMKPMEDSQVVFGQYESGVVDGEIVPGYQEEDGVALDTHTPTFAALRVEVPNWRWQGVPFYLRTGKRLARRLTQIVVTFRRAPVALFSEHAACEVRKNVLVMTLQPDEGFAIGFEVKKPGAEMELGSEHLHFEYSDAFGDLPEAYETLLYDVAAGDQTLFVHADEVEASWRLYAPLLDRLLPMAKYRAGSWGPAEADRLLDQPEAGWPVLNGGK